MRSEDILKNILETIGLPVSYWEYNGVKPEYIVYNEEAEQAANYGDNKPQNEIIWWQVHIFTPKSGEFRKYRETLKTELRQAGFSVSEIVTLYEEETKTIHVVIPCHMGETEV